MISHVSHVHYNAGEYIHITTILCDKGMSHGIEVINQRGCNHAVRGASPKVKVARARVVFISKRAFERAC